MKSKLTLIKDLGMRYPKKTSKQKARFGLYKCECGNIKEINTNTVNRGSTKSCGCSKGEMISNGKKTHGMGHTRIYGVWKAIKSRCYNANANAYHRYGGRGIKMCDAWRYDFKIFYDWSMANGYSNKLTIDRINNDGNYEPNNCRWVTHTINGQNTSTTKLNWTKVLNIRNCLTLGTMTIKQLAEFYNVSYNTVYDVAANKHWK